MVIERSREMTADQRTAVRQVRRGMAAVLQRDHPVTAPRPYLIGAAGVIVDAIRRSSAGDQIVAGCG